MVGQRERGCLSCLKRDVAVFCRLTRRPDQQGVLSGNRMEATWHRDLGEAVELHAPPLGTRDLERPQRALEGSEAARRRLRLLGRQPRERHRAPEVVGSPVRMPRLLPRQRRAKERRSVRLDRSGRLPSEGRLRESA
jgi:hypothetical protein